MTSIQSEYDTVLRSNFNSEFETEFIMKNFVRIHEFACSLNGSHQCAGFITRFSSRERQFDFEGNAKIRIGCRRHPANDDAHQTKLEATVFRGK